MAELCDSCIQNARYKAVLESGQLFFCEHHFRKHVDPLRDTALRIVVMRSK